MRARQIGLLGGQPRPATLQAQYDTAVAQSLRSLRPHQDRIDSA